VALIGFCSNLQSFGAVPDSRAAFSQARHLAHLLDDFGEYVLSRLQGNYVAVAQSLRSDRRLIAVRDRLGGRTLHVAQTRSSWCFAPWAAQALSLSGHSPDADTLSLSAFFAGQAPPSGRTAFAEIRELRPGEILTIDDRGASSEWLPWPLSNGIDYRDTQMAVQAFSQRLEQSVASRLPSGGPVACMLSGGLDSGPMAALASEKLSKTGRQLLPVSWSLNGFPEADETDWIRLLCRHLGLQPGLLDPAERPLDSLDEHLISPDWPAFNPFRSLVEACYREAARLNCRVILNGNAGDDLYPDLDLLYLGFLQQGDYRAIWRDLKLMWKHGGVRALKTHPPLRHELGRRLPWKRNRPPAWMTASAAEHWRSLPDETQSFDWHPVPPYAAQLLGSRMTFGRAHEQYFAERCGVERRDPYHEEQLVGFMLHAPFSLSIREGRTKWIMREAMKGRLPESFRLKPRTGLMSSWFRAGLDANREKVRDLLFRERPGWQEWIQPKIIRRALDGQGRADTLVTRCIGYALWQRHWGA
jgi:asparagine synthase (glutamine-hydrolysing)